MWKMGRIGCENETSKSAVLFCTSICLEDLRKITDVLSHDTWLLDSFMKLRLSRYEGSFLAIWPQRSFNEAKKVLNFRVGVSMSCVPMH
jgi:hypothetical protein